MEWSGNAVVYGPTDNRTITDNNGNICVLTGQWNEMGYLGLVNIVMNPGYKELFLILEISYIQITKIVNPHFRPFPFQKINNNQLLD